VVEIELAGDAGAGSVLIGARGVAKIDTHESTMWKVLFSHVRRVVRTTF
jgi:hypothetical protein